MQSPTSYQRCRIHISLLLLSLIIFNFFSLQYYLSCDNEDDKNVEMDIHVSEEDGGLYVCLPCLHIRVTPVYTIHYLQLVGHNFLFVSYGQLLTTTHFISLILTYMYIVLMIFFLNTRSTRMVTQFFHLLVICFGNVVMN